MKLTATAIRLEDAFRLLLSFDRRLAFSPVAAAYLFLVRW
jgi:hypothetical protein